MIAIQSGNLYNSGTHHCWGNATGARTKRLTMMTMIIIIITIILINLEDNIDRTCTRLNIRIQWSSAVLVSLIVCPSSSGTGPLPLPF